MAERAGLRSPSRAAIRSPNWSGLLRAVNPLAKLEARRELVLDLRKLTFIGPAGLAWLIAVVRRAEDHNLIDGGSVLMPRSPLTQRYLMRMDFLTTLDLARSMTSSSSDARLWLPAVPTVSRR